MNSGLPIKFRKYMSQIHAINVKYVKHAIEKKDNVQHDIAVLRMNIRTHSFTMPCLVVVKLKENIAKSKDRKSKRFTRELNFYYLKQINYKIKKIFLYHKFCSV